MTVTQEDNIRSQIRSHVEAKDFAALKALIREVDVHDLIELIADLPEEDSAMMFRLLPQDQAADAFGDLPIERQEDLLEHLSSDKVTAILNEMPPDERTELLEELPGQVAQRLLSTLRGDQLKIARSLLNYPEDSIGRLMTPEYIAVRKDWSIDQVFEHIRTVGPDKETLNVIYVVDEQWHLVDEITLSQLVLADREKTVADLMDEQVAWLVAGHDQESAIDDFKKYEAVALPVVDRRGVLVGIVTVDDVMDVAEEEDTEDFQKMAGMAALEYSYFGTSFGAMLRKRLPWLVMLLLAQTLTTVALLSFNDMVLFAVLVMFVPLINSPAGNTGSQMAGLMIRGMAVQEIESDDWLRVLVRELLRGLAIGLVLAVIGFAASWLFTSLVDNPVADQAVGRISLSVSLAIAIVVTLANLLGSMLPFFFKRVGLDPAVTSGPFIASLMDVSAILIYFSIAMAVLKLTG